MIQYDDYRIRAGEAFRYGLLGVSCCGVLAFLFFRSMRAFLVLAPCGLIYPFTLKKKLARKRREKLLLQWKEAMVSLGVGLSAGYSVENAFRQTWNEMCVRFGPEQMISAELAGIVRQVEMNVPVERALDDFAERSGLDEVKSFSETFRVAKRSGADLVRILSEAGEVIAARVEVKEEIITMMTSVRLEGKIMNVVPLGILAYIQVSSPLFFRPMYELAAGRLAMGACFLAYMGICWYSQKLMEVEL